MGHGHRLPLPMRGRRRQATPRFQFDANTVVGLPLDGMPVKPFQKLAAPQFFCRALTSVLVQGVPAEASWRLPFEGRGSGQAVFACTVVALVRVFTTMSDSRAQQLAACRRKLPERLSELGPVLRASLIQRFTQCSKAGCRCMRGEKHGPAYYLTVSYAKGRTRQVYVPKDLRPVAAVRYVGTR